MKYTLIITFLLLIQVSWAQSGKITYQFSLAEHGFFYIEGNLYFQGQKSYFNYNVEGQVKFTEKKTDKNVISQPRVESDSTGFLIYTNQTTQTYKQRYLLNGKAYIVNDDSLAFEWQIGNEEKLINGISCQQARVDFRGRKYTAWFAPAIPISAGPWKFHGLPGLIMEISDETNDVFFTVTKIEIPVTLPPFDFDNFQYTGNNYDWLAYKKHTVRQSVKLLNYALSLALESEDGTGSVTGQIIQTEIIPLEDL